MADIAHMQDQISLQHLFQRGAKGRNQLGWQVRDKSDRVGRNHFAPRWQHHAAHRGVKCGKQHILDQNVGPGHRVEQRRFSRVGIPHQRHQRERHFAACGTVQFAGFANPVQLAFQADDLVINGATVRFDLRLAGATHESKTTALAFKVGPGPHQPGALIRQRRQFHLQHAFTGAGAICEYLKYQPGAVQQLDAPGLFKIALLDRRHRPVNQHQINLKCLQPHRQIVNFTRAKKHARMQPRQSRHLGPHHLQSGQSRGQSHRLGQRMIGKPPCLGGFQIGVQHIGAGRFCRRAMMIHAHIASIIVTVGRDVILFRIGWVRDYSSPS